MENNKFNEAIQNSLIEAIIKLIKDNEECMDCPLAKSIVNQLPLQLKQDLYKN